MIMPCFNQTALTAGVLNYISLQARGEVALFFFFFFFFDGYVPHRFSKVGSTLYRTDSFFKN